MAKYEIVNRGNGLAMGARDYDEKVMMYELGSHNTHLKWFLR